MDAHWFNQAKMDLLRHHVLLAIMPVYFLSTGLRTTWAVARPAVVFAACVPLVAALGRQLVAGPPRRASPPPPPSTLPLSHLPVSPPACLPPRHGSTVPTALLTRSLCNTGRTARHHEDRPGALPGRGSGRLQERRRRDRWIHLHGSLARLRRAADDPRRSRLRQRHRCRFAQGCGVAHLGSERQGLNRGLQRRAPNASGIRASSCVGRQRKGRLTDCLRDLADPSVGYDLVVHTTSTS